MHYRRGKTWKWQCGGKSSARLTVSLEITETSEKFDGAVSVRLRIKGANRKNMLIIMYFGAAESPAYNPWSTNGSRGGDVLRGKAIWYQQD